MNKRPLDSYRVVDPHWGVVYEGSTPPDEPIKGRLERKYLFETTEWKPVHDPR